MKHPSYRGRSVSAVWVALLLTGLSPVRAEAAPPTCKGDRATIVGTPWADSLVGTAGADVIVGKGGDDDIQGLGRGDKICGGPGNDYLYGNRGGDRLHGGAGNDSLRGDRGPDRLEGNGGDDSFNIGQDPDRDVIDGGKGLGDLILANFPSRDGDPEGGSRPAHIDLGAGTGRTELGGTDEFVLDSIERVYGSGHGDTIIGDDRANELTSGYSGGGRIEGGGGDDVLREGQDGGTEFYGGPGNDVINSIGERGNIADGGEGTDTYSMAFGGGPMTADLDAGTASVEGESSSSTLISIENLLGSQAADRLSGDDGSNVLDGGRFGGDDLLQGRAGDDTLLGRGGDDQLDGGDGTDAADGGGGSDSCVNAETVNACEG